MNEKQKRHKFCRKSLNVGFFERYKIQQIKEKEKSLATFVCALYFVFSGFTIFILEVMPRACVHKKKIL